MQAYFILGKNEALSRAELGNVLEGVSPVIETGDCLVVDDFDGNLSAMQAKLGGVVKTGVIYASVSNNDELPKALEALVHTVRPGTDKLRFGISVFNAGHRGKMTALRTQVEKIGMKVKDRVSYGGRPVRFVTSKIPVLSSVIVRKQKLLDSGIEFCLFPKGNEILIGVTETVQDFDEWSARDYGRPKRDAARGMLPPKLARIMVNLAGGDSSHTLLDPFCGVGTVLTEAMAVGYTKLVGTDIDEAAVDATRENVEWESARVEMEVDARFIRTKAEALGTFIAPKSVDMIVSELYLGAPRHGDEDRVELERRLDELVTMYTESMRGFVAVMNEGARCVLAVPAYVVDNEILEAQIVERAQLFGLEVDAFEGVETTKQGALRYGREDQLVLRDIYRFKLVD